jgi:hypothetical protein
MQRVSPAARCVCNTFRSEYGKLIRTTAAESHAFALCKPIAVRLLAGATVQQDQPVARWVRLVWRVRLEPVAPVTSVTPSHGTSCDRVARRTPWRQRSSRNAPAVRLLLLADPTRQVRQVQLQPVRAAGKTGAGATGATRGMARLAPLAQRAQLAHHSPRQRADFATSTCSPRRDR